MGKANHKDVQAVSMVVAVAEAAVMKERMAKLLENDFAVVASLLDLLGEHPTVEADATLLGAISSVKTVFMHLWCGVENAASRGALGAIE